jgi:putative ABC transport system permease protein
MEMITKDLRHAFRLFLHRPGFTLIAVLTIALGIGINTAIFSIVNGILLRPLPYPAQDRLMSVFTLIRGTDPDIFSPANFLDVQAQNTSFDSVAVFTTAPYDLSTGSEPLAIPGATVSADFFRVLSVQPLLGRTFLPEDDISGNDQVAILSHDLWKDRFNSDPNVIGRSITVNGAPSTVIGVIPQGMEYPEIARIWTPISFSEEEKTYRGSIYLEMIGRLKPNISLDSAKQELQTIAKQLEREYPLTNKNIGFAAQPLLETLVGNVRRALLVLAASVGFVLLIACANLANLLVANASTRTREFAVRSALGASRKRLLRQLITESLVLSFGGGLLGALLAFWSLPVLRALSPTQLPRIQEITMDWQVLFFTFLISILTGLLFGIVPAFGFSRPDLQDHLKEGTRTIGFGPQSRKLGSALIIAEVGAVLVLLTGAGLMIRSFRELRSVNPGFEPKELISFQLTLSQTRYPERSDRIPFATQMIDRVKAIPGTESVSIVSTAPFTARPEVSDVAYRIYGLPEPAPGEYPIADFTRITPDYFTTMGIPLIRGRFFQDQESGEQTPKVMIISSALAKLSFPGQDPIGQKIVLGRRDPLIFEIVGIVGDVKHLSLNAAIRPEIYIPYFQLPSPNFTVISKVTDATQFVSNVKSQIWSIDRNLPVRFLSPVPDLIGQSMAPARASMFLISGFAALALLLAIIGLYGLIAYSVSQRTREIGVRVALGARKENILAMILRKGMLLTITGAIIGILASLALTRFLSSLLFQVSPTDPAVFFWVSLLLLLTAFFACYIPARRASRVDPIDALRYE